MSKEVVDILLMLHSAHDDGHQLKLEFSFLEQLGILEHESTDEPQIPSSKDTEFYMHRWLHVK